MKTKSEEEINRLRDREREKIMVSLKKGLKAETAVRKSPSIIVRYLNKLAKYKSMKRRDDPGS